MAKKNQPVWKMHGTPEPPVVLGMWSYGTVWTPETHQRPTRLDNVRSQLYWGVWSLDYWGRKVTRDIHAGRAAEPRTTRRARVLDRVALTLAAGAGQLYGLTRTGGAAPRR
jgi:hypothetical protein